MKKILTFLLVIGLIFAAWLWFQTRPADALAKKNTLVKIDSGESLSSIASDLKSKDLIRSSSAFKFTVRISGKAGKLKAGAFLLSPSLSAGEILTVLETGKSAQISVTIPEGFTVKEMDALLASKGLGESGAILDCAFHCDFSTFEFVSTTPTPSPSPEGRGERPQYGSKLEGYLFPDTYYVAVADYQPKFFLERMLGTFRKRIVTAYAADIKKSQRSLADLVTMASVLEAESRGGDERPIVAGILWKRIDAEIALGVDASLRYALSKPTGVLTRGDLAMTSVYNTRLHRGLPPSPIGSPGESAFLAALHPADSRYWYYLHDSDGRIHYAVTNDEHNQNRARYLR